MIEEKIQGLTDAIKILTEQMVLCSEMMMSQNREPKPQLTILPKAPLRVMTEEGMKTEEELDDRGLPVAPIAPEKPKRIRKKKEVVEEDFTPGQLEEIAKEEAALLQEDTLPDAAAAVSTQETSSPKTVSVLDAKEALTAYLNKHKNYASSLLLLKQFKVDTLGDLKAEDFAAFIELSKKGKIEDVLKLKK